MKKEKVLKKFICALCSSPRQMKYQRNLTIFNYAQIFLLGAVLTYFSWPALEAVSLSFFFVVWAIFEAVNKLLYRKEIPCPHCGFDATWYKRDVRVAKKRVDAFWVNKQNNAKGRNKEQLEQAAH